MQGVPRSPSGTLRSSDSGWTAFISGLGSGPFWVSCIYTNAPSGAVSLHSKQDRVWAGESSGPRF